MSNLQKALHSGKIERIEIEIMPGKTFRWKLWTAGKLAVCANGQATVAEIDAMIEASSLITKTMLGVPANAK